MNDRHIQDRQPTEAEVAFAEAMKDLLHDISHGEVQRGRKIKKGRAHRAASENKPRSLDDVAREDPAFRKEWEKTQKRARRLDKKRLPPLPDPVGPLPDAWPQDAESVLVGGFALSGKSTLLTLAARRLRATEHPPRILLLSPNGLEEHNGWDRSVFPEIVYDRVACIARLHGLADRLRAGETLSLPMWLMIDEAADLFDCGQDLAVRSDLLYLLRRGPACGVFLLVNSQYTRRIGRRTAGSFRQKIALPCNVWESRFLIGNSAAAGALPGTLCLQKGKDVTVYTWQSAPENDKSDDV